jgi:DNA-binding Xre family transcriptional regulator
MMDLSQVTPDWIRERMRVKRLRQADVSNAIGIAQHKLSKSLNGHRQFRTKELDALCKLLCDPLPPGTPVQDPETAELLARIAQLGPVDKRVVFALVRSLEEADRVRAEKTEEPDATQG